MTPKWIDLGRASLRYVLGGPETDAGRRPLVLVHEMGGNLETWEFSRRILAANHQVLSYDWRGHGYSEKVRGPITLDDHADDLLALLDATGITEPAVIAGCAVGGAITAAFAARHPARTAGIVIISPAMGVPREVREERRKVADAVEPGGMRAIVDASMASGYPPRFREGREALFETFRARWLATDPGSFAATFRMLVDMEIDPILAAISCPVLAVGGTHDPVRPPAYVKDIAARIAGCGYVEVPGGHHMPLHIPEILAEIIDTFSAEHG